MFRILSFGLLCLGATATQSSSNHICSDMPCYNGGTCVPSPIFGPPHPSGPGPSPPHPSGPSPSPPHPPTGTSPPHRPTTAAPTPNPRGYTCVCPPGYTGPNCGYVVECKPGGVDVYFVVDSTGSIGKNNFNYSRAFVAGLIGDMQVSQNRSQVSVGQFGVRAYEPEFFFNTFQGPNAKADMIQKVWAMQYHAAQKTCIACGMDEATNEGFTRARGDRPDYPDVMVIITDGKQNIYSPTVLQAHNLAVAKNISIIAVGVGDKIDVKELVEATGDLKRVFTVGSFPNITIITGEVCHSIQVVHPCGSSPCVNGGTCHEHNTTYTCECPFPFFGPQCHQKHKCASDPCQNNATCIEKGSIYICQCPPGYTGPNCQNPLPCHSNPCQHGGTCVSSGNATSCICPSGYTGPQCQNVVGCRPNNVDLVFVADSSGSIGTVDFQVVLSFLIDLASQTQVGKNYTRIGMVEFSSNPRYVFYLNSFYELAQITAAIRNTPYIALGTNIASGMNYALNTIFDPQYGSRPSHRRVMVVLTDGQDGSDVADAHAKAEKMGITVLAIGVGVAVDYSELVTIAGNQSRVETINSFGNLTSLAGWTCHKILGS